MWKDHHFYPGHVKSKDSNRKYTIAFEDGDVRSAKLSEIIICDFNIGQVSYFQYSCISFIVPLQKWNLRVSPVHPSEPRSQRWLIPGIGNFVVHSLYHDQVSSGDDACQFRFPKIYKMAAWQAFCKIDKMVNIFLTIIDHHSQVFLLYYIHIGFMGQLIHPWYQIFSTTFSSRSTCRSKVKLRKIMQYHLLYYSSQSFGLHYRHIGKWGLGSHWCYLFPPMTFPSRSTRRSKVKLFKIMKYLLYYSSQCFVMYYRHIGKQGVGIHNSTVISFPL